jgi:SAM-dependent methyltransferase
MSLHLEGFTPRRESGAASWWDDSFTRLLLELLPPGASTLVEIECGLAAAAYSLLPSLPDARYLGFDSRPDRLAEARAALEGRSLKARMELRLGAPAGLPLGEGGADVLLSLMAMQAQTAVPAVLAEALRVLRPGGRLIAVEPDNLGQRFYFDGGLEEVSQAFHALALRGRVVRQPADIALGPRLPALLLEAGVLGVKTRVHLVSSVRQESAQSYFGRLQRVAQALAEACGLQPDDELALGCEAALKRALFAGLPKRLGHSCHLVPVFVCAGDRPG